MSRLALAAAVALGLVLASLPFVHYRMGGGDHGPNHTQKGGSHAHHAD